MTDKYISIRPDNNNRGSTRQTEHITNSTTYLQNSAYRQQHLRQYAQIITDEDDIEVTVSERADTASIHMMGEDTTPQITIPTFDSLDVNNPYDIDDELFYSILMYAEIDHECGHYNFSDHPSLKANMDRLDRVLADTDLPVNGGVKQLCKNVWNAIEDGVMEEAVIQSRGPMSQERLHVKNATFIAQTSESAPEDYRTEIEFTDALLTAAMDSAKYDSGAFRRLLDEDDDSWQFADGQQEFFHRIYSPLRQTIEECFTLSDGAERTTRIFDFLIEDVIPICAEITDNTDSQQNHNHRLRQNQTDDTESNSGPAQKPSPTSQGQDEDNATQRLKAPEQPQQSSQSQATDPSSSDGADSPPSSGTDDRITCPDCGATDTSRLIQQVGGMIAARTNMPFDPSAKWVNSIQFISNQELCGFRVEANTVPAQSIVEQEPHKMEVTSRADSSNPPDTHTVEILEPKSNYDKYESVNGFECNSCTHKWVPVISGNRQ